MTPEQLLENFQAQKTRVAEEARNLENELAQKKELYLKLQGAIEAMQLQLGGEASGTEAVPVATEVVTED
jgi:L-serine deaminase